MNLVALARVSLALFVSAVAVGCGGGSHSPTGPRLPDVPAPEPKVAILSVDGLRPDALTVAGAANILALAQQGAYTWGAQTVSPSETLPAHSSMLSGHLPSVHGMTWADYDPQRGFIQVPTIFAIVRGAGRRTAMVVSKSKLLHLNVPGTVDSFVSVSGDAAVASEAIARAQTGFHLMFVHFADVDLAGHSHGWMSSAYLAKVSELDGAVGRLLSALPRETTVILSADHGGSGRNHAAALPENRTIPWLIAGPKIAPRALGRAVRTVDTAATALHVLGLTLTGCSGVVVTEAFGQPGSSSTDTAVQAAPGLDRHLPLAFGDDNPANRNRRSEEVGDQPTRVQ